jgi:hypothetical protein
MPSATSQANRHTFASAGPPRPGAFRPAGAPQRTTSRGMNDAVIRTSNSPRVRPRTADATIMFRQLTHTGVSFITAYAQFSEGVLEGLEDSLKSAWSLVSRDMWQWRTYTELATTVTALGMIQPFNIPAGLVNAQAFDRRWGTHVTQRQVDIMAAINQLVLDVPRWTPRQWGRAVGRLVGDIVLAKGAGAAVKVAAQASVVAARASMVAAQTSIRATVRVAVSESVQVSTIATRLQSLGKIPVGAGRLAKARAIIPVYARYTTVRAAIPFLDVSAGVNKTTFWSGLNPLTPTGQAFEHAEVLAKASGRTTLEMTKGGSWLGRQTNLLGNGKELYVDWQSQMRPQWGRLSARFAKQARGTVEMYRGPRYAGANSVWEEFEQKPLLESLKSGRVTDIKEIDVPKK